MTSIIKVDQIQLSDGSTPTIGDLGVNDTGTVLQQVSGWCDGRTVGGVTFPNVTATQTVNSTGYVKLTGSDISYTPPAGTTTVLYHLSVQKFGEGNGAINHFRFYIGSDEVTIFRTTHAQNYQGANQHEHDLIDFIMPIQIGSTDDVANAKLSSWTSAKTLKVDVRAYGSGYYGIYHENEWMDGVGASGDNRLRHPTITITAIK